MSPTASCQSSLIQIAGTINRQLVAASCIGSECAAHLHHGFDWSVSPQPSPSSNENVDGSAEIQKTTESTTTDSTCKPQTIARLAGPLLPGALAATRPSFRHVMTQLGLHLTTPRYSVTHHTMSSFMKRCLSTSTDTNSVQTGQQSVKQQPAQLPTTEKHVIYKGPWILPFRLLVRAKVFQLVGCSGIALAVAAVMTSPDAGSSDAAAAVALAVCCAAASYSLWYYSRRYVGELALLEGGKVVRFSVLDFWGNREDVDVPVASVRPMFQGVRQDEIRRVCSQTLFPVDVTGDRQYYLSAKHGNVQHKELLMKLLDGRLLQEQQQQH